MCEHQYMMHYKKRKNKAKKFVINNFKNCLYT